ncbi:DUF4034 domain-containing protein [Dyella sp. 20L07]|uniref:DUF4034 domain-containing protein n=1 Tax=Dyella sp. 20L07 TaxID=3384240 RepID=UPI003D2D2D93
MIEFLAKVKSAESITDPIQRCLAYPDAPGSHWDPAIVRAYCHYRHQPLITLQDIRELIHGGREVELDRRMQEALTAQQNDPDARSRLDLSYQRAIKSDFKDLRPLFDAWKQASPKSAFAYAASGYLYVQEALNERGEDYASKTATVRLQKMHTQLAFAEADLYQAIALNPRVTPAYAALIQGSNIGESHDYAEHAIDQALSVDPNNFSIYESAMQTQEPRWGGSLESMQSLVDKALGNVKENPLLGVFQKEVAFYQINRCECSDKQQVAAYTALFSRPSTSAHLWSAGDAATDANATPAALVFLSETLRFNPWATRARAQRSINLSKFGDAHWAMQDADLSIKEDPKDAAGYRSRAFALESMNDYSRAELALKEAVALDASDSWSLVELGNIYGFHTREWDKAWAISEEAIRKFPDVPYGWVLRAKVQMDQPRAGIKATYEEFSRRFSNDPDQQEAAAQMRAAMMTQGQ